MANPKVVLRLLVGAPKPGSRPIRLANRIKKKKVPKYGTYFLPCLPMIASLCRTTTNSSNSSAILRAPKPSVGMTGSAALASDARALNANQSSNSATTMAKNVCAPMECWRPSGNKLYQVNGCSILLLRLRSNGFSYRFDKDRQDQRREP